MCISCRLTLEKGSIFVTIFLSYGIFIGKISDGLPHNSLNMPFFLIFILHLWTQILSNCHVQRFVVKRIIDQYKNRMFIHCRRGLYRKAWLSRDIYLSCVSQYWRGIKRAAMLTNRYGRSFQWGKSLSKDFKNILDELTDCYGGNKDTMFIKYG